MKRILIVGTWQTIHVRRFLHVLTEHVPNNLIVDSYDLSSYSKEAINGVNTVYYTLENKFCKYLIKVPKVRVFVQIYLECKTLSGILKKNHYSMVNIHQIPWHTFLFVKIAKRNNTKIMLTPFGSDVLRVSNVFKGLLRNAFKNADYVSLNNSTGFASICKKIYGIGEKKIADVGYGSNTTTAILACKERDKEKLANKLSIKAASYYITCGYNATLGQQHEVILDAINKNKHFLPEDTTLIFPLTYGSEKDYLYELLSNKCKEYGLSAVFLNNFLSVDEVAALRYITDLFIHIQITDAYNASLQEFLLAGASVVNGKWLSYPSLEKGGIPYYECENTKQLSNLLRKIFNSEIEKPTLSESARSEILKSEWSTMIKRWINFYLSLS